MTQETNTEHINNPTDPLPIINTIPDELLGTPSNLVVDPNLVVGKESNEIARRGLRINRLILWFSIIPSILSYLAIKSANETLELSRKQFDHAIKKDHDDSIESAKRFVMDSASVQTQINALNASVGQFRLTNNLALQMLAPKIDTTKVNWDIHVTFLNQGKSAVRLFDIKSRAGFNHSFPSYDEVFKNDTTKSNGESMVIGSGDSTRGLFAPSLYVDTGVNKLFHYGQVKFYLIISAKYKNIIDGRIGTYKEIWQLDYSPWGWSVKTY